MFGKLWWVAALAVTFVQGCGDESEDAGGVDDRGDVVVQRSAGSSEAHAEVEAILREIGLAEGLATSFNGRYALPRDLVLDFRSCGTANAFYDPAGPRITMCYELAEHVVDAFKAAGHGEEEVRAGFTGVWLFVLLHEWGHALVDLYDLPITGREEDAVDGFSTWQLVRAGQPASATWAASFFGDMFETNPSARQYADEHSLNAQRFFNVLCWVYGSDPQNHGVILEKSELPQERAERCPAEWAQQDGAWTELLAPWRLQ